MSSDESESGSRNSYPDISIAIFSSREDVRTLLRTVRAAMDASRDFGITIDVVVNGNRLLAEEIGDAVRTMEVTTTPEHPKHVRVWFLAQGDKAHAWNTYVYEIWPETEIAFFNDGYASVRPDALERIAAALLRNNDALAAGGVPTMGRSASELSATQIKKHDLAGNLYALRGSTVQSLRLAEFRLPLGMYRTLSTLAAAIMFKFDPANNKWDKSVIEVVPEATWSTQPRHWWKISHLRSHYKRMLSQAFGAFAMRAVRETFAIKRQPIGSLPRYANDLVADFIDENPVESRRIAIRNPLWLIAKRRLKKPSSWELTEIPPELLQSREIGTHIPIESSQAT